MAPPWTPSASWPILTQTAQGAPTAEIVETYREAKDYAKAEAEADAAVKKLPKDRIVSRHPRHRIVGPGKDGCGRGGSAPAG